MREKKINITNEEVFKRRYVPLVHLGLGIPMSKIFSPSYEPLVDCSFHYSVLFVMKVKIALAKFPYLFGLWDTGWNWKVTVGVPHIS